MKAFRAVWLFASVLVVLALSASPAVAKENASEQPDKEMAGAGIMPDSFLYGLDKAFDRLSIALIRNPEVKARKSLEVAGERLLEIKAMLEKGKLEQAERVGNYYSDLVEKAAKSAEAIESGGSTEKAKEALAKIAKLKNQTESHYEKVAEIKDTILERQKERISEEQFNRLEQVFDGIKEKSAEIENRLDSKSAKVKTKQKVLAESGAVVDKKSEKPAVAEEGSKVKKDAEKGKKESGKAKSTGKEKGSSAGIKESAKEVVKSDEKELDDSAKVVEPVKDKVKI